MKRVLLAFSLIFSVLLLFAQTPLKFSYQAVVRNSSNQPVADRTVGLKISILKGSNSGIVVYSEVQTPRTSGNGVVSVEVGGGAGFSSINWSDDSYFIKTEIDPEGGANYVLSGVSQMISVPYALNAKVAESLSGGLNESDPFFLNHIANTITSSQIGQWNDAYSWGNHSGLYRPISYVPTWSEVVNKPNLASVAISGDYADLINKPALFDGTWTSLTGKPTLSFVATSGSYSDLSNKPTLFDGSWTSLTGRPNFATVATSGSYNDLSNRPTLFDGAWNSLTGKPTFSAVATSGSFTDISNKPTTLAGYGITDAFNGNYNSLTNRPTLFDGTWNSLTGKPTLAAIATSGSFTDISNKPTTLAGYGITDAFNGSYTSLTNKPVDATTSASGFMSATDKTKLNGLQNADGSETKITAGTNISISGAGTTANPYVVTNTSVAGTSVGDILYWNGSAWVLLPRGGVGQVLTVSSSNIPTWQNLPITGLFPPSISNPSVTNILSFSATLNGSVNANGLSTTVEFEYGISDSYGAKATVLNAVTGNNNTAVSVNLSGLLSNTLYHYRIKASNAVNVVYSSDLVFTTSISAPEITTDAITSLGALSAVSGGNVTKDGGATITARGVCWGTSSNPTTANSNVTSGTGAGAFVSNITGLTPNTLYYVRAFATNSVGTSYGNEQTFTTRSGVISLTSREVSTVTSTNALSGGDIYDDGGAPVTARGVCWGTMTTPTIANSKTTDGNGVGGFNSTLTSLEASRIYYYRAYATNGVGTYYGDVFSFTTNSVDGSGNEYPSVTIGTQIWMGENLNTDKYNDGTPIPNVTDITAWLGLTTGAYCDYDNTPSNSTTYGKLYNWYAVTDSKNVCPLGWHIPSDAEWLTLERFINDDLTLDGTMTGYRGMGGWKLKSVSGWYSNSGGTDDFGFTGLPGGGRDGGSGAFGNITKIGGWWSTTQATITNAWFRTLNYTESGSGRLSANKKGGYSVRCIKN